MRDGGARPEVFALAVRLIQGEPVTFNDAFGHEYVATDRLIVRLPSRDAVRTGDSFEIANAVRQIVTFRPARAEALRRAGGGR